MSPEDSPQPIPSSGLFDPGAAVFVVPHKDPFRERIDVRPSRVLDREGDVLFLAQTTPPVPATLRGAEVEIAVLPPKDVQPRRPVGYTARILDLVPAFPSRPEALSGERGATAPALAVSAPRPGDLFETSLRMHYRVPVEPQMNIVLRLGGGFRVTLLDFSAGGARAKISPPAPQAAPTWPVPPLSAQRDPEAEEPDRERLDDVGVGAPAPSPSPDAQHDPRAVALGRSLPFRLLFLGSGFAEGDAVVRSVRPDPDGVSVVAGMCFTNMEIRDIRYLERMVARTVAANHQHERDADYE